MVGDGGAEGASRLQSSQHKVNIHTGTRTQIPQVQLVIRSLCAAASPSRLAVESERKTTLCWHEPTWGVFSWKTRWDTELGMVSRDQYSLPCNHKCHKELRTATPWWIDSRAGGFQAAAAAGLCHQDTLYLSPERRIVVTFFSPPKCFF